MGKNEFKRLPLMMSLKMATPQFDPDYPDQL